MSLNVSLLGTNFALSFPFYCFLHATNLQETKCGFSKQYEVGSNLRLSFFMGGYKPHCYLWSLNQVPCVISLINLALTFPQGNGRTP